MAVRIYICRPIMRSRDRVSLPDIGRTVPYNDNATNVRIPRGGTSTAGDRDGDVAACKNILLLCPTMWDEAELPRIVAPSHYCVVPFGTDVSEHPEAFDALGFIKEAIAAAGKNSISGVIASDDYPGSIIAAVTAQELGLPGPNPTSVLLCHHKYYSRVAQRAAIPEAVPDFALIDPQAIQETASGLNFPVFVKPVKSFFSIMAQQIGSIDELATYARQSRFHLTEFVKPFNQLFERYASLPLNGGFLLAEQVLRGRQVTVEGCLFRGEGAIIGITDSIMYAGTNSFRRFEHPSCLRPTVQKRMGDLAIHFMQSIEFDNGLFNVEMFYDDEADLIHIIEANPRMCPQFADLMEKVNGVNTYQIALAIAAGERPALRASGAQYRCATSFVLRVFEDRKVVRVPSRDELATFQMHFPDARLKVLCREGCRLSDELQDGRSYRYAVLNLGGDSAKHLDARFAEAMSHLTFEFH